LDLNDPNEVIDLRAQSGLYSLQDFHQIFHYDLPLRVSPDHDLYSRDARPEGLYQAVCMSPSMVEEAPNDCWIALVGITKDQILSHPEKFVFQDVHNDL